MCISIDSVLWSKDFLFDIKFNTSFFLFNINTLQKYALQWEQDLSVRSIYFQAGIDFHFTVMQNTKTREDVNKVVDI